ncbi:MAG: RNA 2',3'-cyclic phosphodiesterase [Hyphomicrobiaceae bacterium]|jgi:2'-5' RNA ligase
MPRLFTGIEIPDHLREALARLRQPLPGARWIEPEDYHITLRFAGDVDRHVAAEFARALSDIELETFELRFNGMGAFGGNDPKTLWAGIELTPELDALARAHERAARLVGLQPETRRFKPHVTLARLRGTSVDILARYLQRNGGFRTPPFRVSRFVLFSSKPQVGGGPYVIEETYTLVGGEYAEYEDEY